MQSLGLSDSTPRSESRLKSLFWPSIESGADVEYLGSQGYWVCTIVAVLTLVMSAAMGQVVMAILLALFFYLGGVGVRERSPYAATVVFVLYALNVVAAGPGVVNILILALLLSNLRATWIAARWKPESEEAALPPRFDVTFGDKFAGIFPRWLWPKIRVLYYVFSAAMLVLIMAGFVYLKTHGGKPLYR